MKALLPFLNQFIILFSFLHLVCLADISNLRKCADELCSVKISEGRTTQRYLSRERGILHFAIDEKVNIYSKEAGTNPNLWGVEIIGSSIRKGFIPKKFVVEEKVLVKEDELKHVVPIISAGMEGNKTKKYFSSENESEAATNPEGSNKIIIGNLLDEVKVIDQLPELPSDNSNIERSKNVNINGQELNIDNENGEKAPVNTNQNVHVELKDYLNIQSVDLTIENVIIIGDKKQDELISENANVDSSESVQENNEINVEENSLKRLSQTGENIEPREESIVTSEAPTILPQETSGEINTNSNKIQDDSGADSLKIDDPVLKDNVGESPVVKNIDDRDDRSNDEDDEAMDNEDEGNGNEGEENGKEMDIRPNSENDESTNSLFEGKEMKGDLASNKVMVTNIAEELIKAPRDIIPITDTLINKNLNSLPKPTPSRNYEVFEGTTLFIDDVNENSDDIETSSVPADVSTSSLPLQTSQILNEKQESHATPLYEATAIPMVTTDGINVPNKEKSSLSEELVNSNIIIDEEPTSSLPLENANNKLNPDLSKSGSNVMSDVLDDKMHAKNADSIVNMATKSDEITQASNLTDPDFTNSDVEKPRLSSEVKSETIKESSDEDEFVSPKPKSILTEIDTVADKPLEEPENKSFIESFFSNFGSSQDAYVDTDTLEEQSSEAATDVNEKRMEEENNTATIYLPFSDPYKEISDESNNDVSEMLSEDQQKKILSEGLTKDPIMETASTIEKSSFSEVILGIPRSLIGEGFALALEEEVAHPHLSTRSMSLLVILAIVIVTLYIAHSIIIKISREAPLLNAMNKLDKEQRLVIEENNNLKRMLSTTSNGQIKSASSNLYDHIEFVRLKDELSTTKSNLELELEQLKQHNLQLEKDLESSTANEEELNRMISELLSCQNDTQSFEESVNFLQATLDDQKEKVESLTADLAHKTRLNDELRAELRKVKERSSKLEYQIEQLAQSLDDMKSLKQDTLKRLSEEENNVLALTDVNNSMRQEADAIRKHAAENNAYVLNLKESVKDLQKKLDSKMAECKVSKECFKKLQLCSDGGNNTKGKLAEIFKIVEVKAKLEIAEKERLESETKLGKELEEHELVNKFMVDLQMQRDELQEKFGNVENERNDAKAKLSILTQVYEEKVAQLKSELESQEELRQDAEGSAADITNRVQSCKLELQSYKDQVLSLKQELEKQHQSYKLQLANEEKKLNDTWLSARNAERRQEELRQENTQLRQKLTQMHKESDQNILQNSIKRGVINGNLSSPVPGENNFDGIHSPPAPLPMDFDGPLPPMPPMFMPHHMLQGHPPPPPHLGPPPPHLGPPHPGFLHHPFMGPPPSHLPPPHPDRRLPPAGRIASPPGYDRRSYSPCSDYSDQRYSPGPRYSPGGGNRNRSPDRRSDRSRQSNVNMRRKEHDSPDRWYSRSPQRFKQRQSPIRYFNHDENFDESKGSLIHAGKKTSTPLGPNDR